MKMSLRLLCGVLLTAFALSGCAEQILDSASKDPAPTVTSGEENTPIAISKFSTTDGIAPQPTDLVLGVVNASLDENSQIDNVSALMPIRIPFSSPLADLYTKSGDWNDIMGAELAKNILIISVEDFLKGNLAGVKIPLPTSEGGSFRAVHFEQDINYDNSTYDLVLLPEVDTFSSDTTYVVALKNSLKDASGNQIQADILADILIGPGPIEKDGKIVNTLVRELVKNEPDGGIGRARDLEGLRLKYSALAAGLASLPVSNPFHINSYKDLALLFTFTTEVTVPSGDTTALLQAAQSNIASDNLSWISLENLSGSSTIPSDDPENLLPLISQQSPDIPMTELSALNKGYVACQNLLIKTEKGWLLDLSNPSPSVNIDKCPNSNQAFNGKLGFWLAKPDNVSGIVVFQHGITASKDTMFAIMNTFAKHNFATVAIDAWGHGERTYEDSDGDGDLADDSGLRFMRPDYPLLTLSYMVQTQFDIILFRTLLEANNEMYQAIGNTPGQTPIYFAGMSLGGIFGSNLANNIGTASSFKRFLLSAPGGDIADIILSGGSYGPTIKAAVAAELEDPSELNTAMLGLNLVATHTLFKGGVDPLVTTIHPDASNSSEVLVQQITGDSVIPNANTELLSLAMGLTTLSDGDTHQGTTRTRWVIDPSNYQGGTAGHSFLLDGKTEATLRTQQQAACFLATGKVLDPSKEINITTCTNTN
jgi:pimeloyl-ACP methyl ester carboxylesterase